MTGPLADLRPWAPRKHALRGLVGGAAKALNFYALGPLPVTHAQALGYLAPVLTIPAAVNPLGERLTLRTVFAVALGFAAVIAVLRLHIKMMTVAETTIFIALSFTLVTTGLGAGPYWRPGESR